MCLWYWPKRYWHYVVTGRGETFFSKKVLPTPLPKIFLRVLRTLRFFSDNCKLITFILFDATHRLPKIFDIKFALALR